MDKKYLNSFYIFYTMSSLALSEEEAGIKKEELIASIDKLYLEYSDNNDVIKKLKYYLDNQLPNLLNKFIDREKEKKYIEKEVTEFTNNFLNTGGYEYYYIKKTDLYIKYNGKHFSIIDMDDLIYSILTGLNTNKNLRKKKHQIKNNIIKIIRENDLIKSIPNSYTIQFILDYLTPIFIKDRNTTKYFLTILGDCILKKKTNNLYYVLPSCNEFIKYLKEHFISYFKNTVSIDEIFTYRYNSEEHNNHRLVDFNKNKQIDNNWDIFLRNHVLDIYTISVHYSLRFKSAEGFLNKHLHNSNSKNKILFFKNNSKEEILEKFIKKYVTNMKNINITKMELYYLWLYYLNENRMPNIFINETFNIKFCKLNEIKYDSEKEYYTGFSSNYLCRIKIFRMFWDETMEITEEENNESIETSELFNLFNDWLIEKKSNCTMCLDQLTMISVYKHFYNIKIKNNKIIENVYCSLWNKKESINEILDELREQYKLLNETKITYTKLYKDYCENLMINNKNRVVSKQYFYEYIGKVIPQQYIKENYILKEYWN